ncbi:grass carp reovirus (GCRV)-induced gene 2o isoform X2 [Electrophorus electricus]|nr:grass carp reovirus (GCRV)-induced gene 2o isoform X2 [Electrophorus electricus]
MAQMVNFAGWRTVEETLSSGKKPKNSRVYPMYHGTHINNAKDIIINGFKASIDGLLGQGVYVSRNIDKAKCYPLNTDKRERVVFKLKVNVGKVKKIDCDNHPLQKSWHQNGYDSAWIPPNSNVSAIKSGREEDCVWDPIRITVIGVVCCMDNDKRWELRRLIRNQLRTGECSLCGQNTPDRPHHIQDCWECSERICLFQREHRCVSK